VNEEALAHWGGGLSRLKQTDRQTNQPTNKQTKTNKPKNKQNKTNKNKQRTKQKTNKN
jgi:hypothetical protein